MLKGLANVGNTCSINTLVQCIGHCPLLLDFILNRELIITKCNDRNFAVYEELKTVLKILWCENNSIIPRRFIQAFYESIGSRYEIGEQFDFTEMWTLLLDNIIHETHDASFIPDYQIENSNCQMQKKVQDSLNMYFKNSQSPLNNLLYGSQIQHITCQKCENSSHIIEPVAFSYIRNSSIYEGIKDIFKSQIINDWKCEKCSHNEARTNVEIWKIPKIWVLVLQRYNNTTKITTPIDIPLNINFHDNNTSYQLKSIANHYGSFDSGHYTATCVNNDGSWCEYNDLQILKINDIKDVLMQNKIAYVLFYQRI